MSSTNPDKMGFIKAYFDALDKKIDFLSTLLDAGFKDEALTLSLVYIDGLAQRLGWPCEQNSLNYVNALTAFSKDVELGLVHPKQLAETLGKMKSVWHPISAGVRSAFPGPSYELVPPQAVLAKLTNNLSAQQFADLQREIWRGTIAAVAYFWMRNPAVHALGASTLTFGDTSYAGQPAQALDLPRLQRAAKNLAAEVRQRSEASGEWFGNELMLS